MPTATKALTLNAALDLADPNKVADALRQYKLGTTETKIKATVTALTAIAAPNITALVGASLSIVINQGPDSVKNAGVLPPVGKILSLRVTASGTGASVGSYILSDSGGTPTLPTGGASAGVGIATLSDDGTTITFPNTITAFVIEYYAAPAAVGANGLFVGVNLNANFEQ